jgi:hypothetical protein
MDSEIVEAVGMCLSTRKTRMAVRLVKRTVDERMVWRRIVVEDAGIIEGSAFCQRVLAAVDGPALHPRRKCAGLGGYSDGKQFSGMPYRITRKPIC